MYTPKIFQNTDTSEVLRFIRENGFGILITGGAKILATHIPLHLTEDGKFLHGHLARANDQWKNLNNGDEVLSIFNGPHAYISSSWYNHENVPTWNYIAVHVYGKIRIIEGEELIRSLAHLVDKYEKDSANPVSVERMSPSYLNSQIKGLVGIEVEITNMQASYKLSQNRDRVNHEAILHQLEKRNQGDDTLVADEMKKHFPQSK